MTCNLEIAHLAVVVVALLLLQGCTVVSLNPLTDWDHAVSEPRFTGQWVCGAAPDSIVLQVSGDRLYSLDFTSGNENPAKLYGLLTRIGTGLFLDVSVPLDENHDSFPTATEAHLLRAHSFWRVEVGGDEVRISGLAPERVLSELKDQPLVSYTQYDGNVLFTASTEGLRAWLAANMDNARVFEDEPLLLFRSGSARAKEGRSCAAQE